MCGLPFFSVFLHVREERNSPSIGDFAKSRRRGTLLQLGIPGGEELSFDRGFCHSPTVTRMSLRPGLMDYKGPRWPRAKIG
jgi:hypothetical protein